MNQTASSAFATYARSFFGTSMQVRKLSGSDKNWARKDLERYRKNFLWQWRRRFAATPSVAFITKRKC
jgi:hypothetical protein